MFYLRSEGEPIRYGFNFYPWKDRKYHIGVILKLMSWKFSIRWSAKLGKLFYSFHRKAA